VSNSIVPSALYRERVANQELESDPEQLRILAILDQCLLQLLQPKAEVPWWQRWTGRTPPTKNDQLGCYLWGGVGRGKTLLMDCLARAAKSQCRVLRTHFHEFMQNVHQQLQVLQGQANPLQALAQHLRADYDLLLLDEFLVNDITDAMLLAGLLEQFFRSGLFLVTTSNVAPVNLYRDGLQRGKFLPTIDLLNQHLIVVPIAPGEDYRRRTRKLLPTYQVGLDAVATRLHFQQILGDRALEAGQQRLCGRVVHFEGLGDDGLWFEFEQLCGQGRSVQDYLALSRQLQVLCVSGVQSMGERMDDQARRFVLLVDTWYEAGLALYIAAQVPLLELYHGQRLAFEFERTQSRLIEMQSSEYLVAGAK